MYFLTTDNFLYYLKKNTKHCSSYLHIDAGRIFFHCISVLWKQKHPPFLFTQFNYAFFLFFVQKTRAVQSFLKIQKFNQYILMKMYNTEKKIELTYSSQQLYKNLKIDFALKTFDQLC